MKTGTRNLIIAAVVVFLVIFVPFSWVKGAYNGLVNLDEETNKAWAQVENQLQRRLNLIPNLVSTVKGYAEHEKGVLTAVTEARARVGSAQTIPDKMDANRQLTSALGRLMVVMENYPNLKADQSFLGLQAQLEGTENRISVERRRYNESVGAYNKAIRQFPTAIIAGMTGFERKPFFEADDAAQKVPEVKF